MTILNINPGKNEELKNRCPVLKEYTQYVEKVRENSTGMPLQEAVEQAIEYCIKNDILRDFLTEQKAEVVKMSIFEYDEQREIELIRRDEREIGKEIGERIGIEKERQNTEKERLNTEKERENTIQSIISFGQKLGGSEEQIVKELQERCGLERKQAKEKIRQYLGK